MGLQLRFVNAISSGLADGDVGGGFGGKNPQGGGGHQDVNGKEIANSHGHSP